MLLVVTEHNTPTLYLSIFALCDAQYFSPQLHHARHLMRHDNCHMIKVMSISSVIFPQQQRRLCLVLHQHTCGMPWNAHGAVCKALRACCHCAQSAVHVTITDGTTYY